MQGCTQILFQYRKQFNDVRSWDVTRTLVDPESGHAKSWFVSWTHRTRPRSSCRSRGRSVEFSRTHRRGLGNGIDGAVEALEEEATDWILTLADLRILQSTEERALSPWCGALGEAPYALCRVRSTTDDTCNAGTRASRFYQVCGIDTMDVKNP